MKQIVIIEYEPRHSFKWIDPVNGPIIRVYANQIEVLENINDTHFFMRSVYYRIVNIA